MRPWPIPVNELRAGGTGLPTVALERAALVAATAVRVRSPAAKPDGKMGCKTSGTGCDWRVQTTLRIPDAGSKKIRNHALALARAGLRRRGVGGFRRGREHFLGLSGLATFGAATSIPLALSLPFLPSIRGLSILPLGESSPPSPSGRPAFGTAISGLGVGGIKGLLTSLEKTPSLTRPTSPLTGPKFAASWCWAQGSCELPTAKPRMRSPYLRSEAPSLINSALVGVRHSHLKADPLGFQANPPDTT